MYKKMCGITVPVNNQLSFDRHSLWYTHHEHETNARSRAVALTLSSKNIFFYHAELLLMELNGMVYGLVFCPNQLQMFAIV